MAYRTDLQRVQGLGAAGDGVHHWWAQRVSAIALIPLTPAFVIPFGRALGGGTEALLATYGSFGHALVAVLFIAVVAWHMMLGLQVVIEDYVQGGARVVTLLLAKFFCGAFGAAGVLAVATILFRA